MTSKLDTLLRLNTQSSMLALISGLVYLANDWSTFLSGLANTLLIASIITGTSISFLSGSTNVQNENFYQGVLPGLCDHFSYNYMLFILGISLSFLSRIWVFSWLEIALFSFIFLFAVSLIITMFKSTNKHISQTSVPHAS